MALAFGAPGEAGLPEPPLGLDLYMPVPEDNALTPEKVALGRRLFFDKRLSRDGSVSCSSCHDPERAFSDGRAVAVGVFGRTGRRNAPALGSLDAWMILVQEGGGQGAPKLVKKGIGDVGPMGFTRKGAFYYSVGTGTLDVQIAELDSATGKILASQAPVNPRAPRRSPGTR